MKATYLILLQIEALGFLKISHVPTTKKKKQEGKRVICGLFISIHQLRIAESQRKD